MISPTARVAPASHARIESAFTLPDASAVSFRDVLSALNPLQYVPGVGTIYRAVTGETIPAPLRILGAGIFGGPIGILGAALMSFAEALFSMAPDLSRPSAPAGMAATGSETPMGAVTPGTMQFGEYTTLATTTPEFLQSPTQFAGGDRRRGLAAYQEAGQEWQRSQALEKGLA